MAKPLILITRPEEDGGQIARRMQAHGYAALVEPMLHFRPLQSADATMKSMLEEKLQAVVVTSRHALPFLQLYPQLFSLPLFAVGRATATKAVQCGFTTTHYARNAQSLLKKIMRRCVPFADPLLYARGQDVAHDLAGHLRRQDFRVEEVIVYEMHPCRRFSDTLIKHLEAGTLNIATFLSARTAEVFTELIRDTPYLLQVKNIRAVAISENVAERLRGLPWQEIAVCAEPTLDSFMAAVDKLVAPLK